MELALGIIIGILLAAIAQAAGEEKKAMQLFTRPVKTTLRKVTGQKVEFLSPLEPTAEALAEVMKQNDAQGRDTKLDEI